MSANPPSIYRQLLTTSLDSMLTRIQQVYREEPVGDRSSLILSAFGLMSIYDEKVFLDRKIIDRVIILTYAALSGSTMLVVRLVERMDRLRRDIQNRKLPIGQVSETLGSLIKEQAGSQRTDTQDETAFQRLLDRMGREMDDHEQPPASTSATHSSEAPNSPQSGSVPSERSAEDAAQVAFPNQMNGVNESQGASIRTRASGKTKVRYGPDIGRNGVPENLLRSKRVDLSGSNRSTNEQILNDGECNISYGPKFL